MRDVLIESWDALHSAVFENVWDPAIMRYRNNRVYRGMSDGQWALTPSLNRACPQDLSLEKILLRSFMKYGYTELQGCNSFWELVAMGQQFGLPTRLLDWTYSPLVAAHFATEDIDYYDRDGVIWCVNIEDVNANLPPSLRQKLSEQRADIFTRDILEDVAHNFTSLQALSDQPFALFFEPASTVNRIANQYALFSAVSDPAVTLLDLPESECFVRLIISKKAKLEIRDKLDYINISERMIYPGLASAAGSPAATPRWGRAITPNTPRRNSREYRPGHEQKRRLSKV